MRLRYYPSLQTWMSSEHVRAHSSFSRGNMPKPVVEDTRLTSIFDVVLNLHGHISMTILCSNEADYNGL
jgi:hypothetical protein